MEEFIPRNLTNDDLKIINRERGSGWLEDLHMSIFLKLLKEKANNNLRPPFLRHCLEQITPVRSDHDHIQILHRPDHWTCSYYDTKKIYIYDSQLSSVNLLHADQKNFLEKLYPHMHVNKQSVVFPKVQQQKSLSFDCGVFPNDYVVSLAYGIPPENIHYENNILRAHLLKILTTGNFDHFPQDPTFIMRNILALPVALRNKYETLSRLRRKANINVTSDLWMNMSAKSNSHFLSSHNLSASGDSLSSVTQNLSARSDSRMPKNQTLSTSGDSYFLSSRNLSASGDSLSSFTQNLSARSDSRMPKNQTLSTSGDSLPSATQNLPAKSDSRMPKKQNQSVRSDSHLSRSQNLSVEKNKYSSGIQNLSVTKSRFTSQNLNLSAKDKKQQNKDVVRSKNQNVLADGFVSKNQNLLAASHTSVLKVANQFGIGDIAVLTNQNWSTNCDILAINNSELIIQYDDPVIIQQNVLFEDQNNNDENNPKCNEKDETLVTALDSFEKNLLGEIFPFSSNDNAHYVVEVYSAATNETNLQYGENMQIECEQVELDNDSGIKNTTLNCEENMRKRPCTRT